MLNIAVLASGNGSNLQAIIDSIESGSLEASIKCIISDHGTAFALERANTHHIPAFHISPKIFSTREEHEKAMSEKMDGSKVQLIVLAGYMRLLTPWFIQRYRLKIINIHPALLPAFPGAHSIKDAFIYGVKVTGVTVHFVDEGVDTGPIIAQVPVEIETGESLESLEQKIHAQEHLLYPKVIQWFAENRIYIEDRKVFIK